MAEGEQLLPRGGDGRIAGLWDVGWGAERATRYAARCVRHVDTGSLQLRTQGRAEVRADFPYAAGRGPQRAEAARAVAARFGLQTRQVGRCGQALRFSGSAEDVARFAAALPRMLEHAEQLASWAARMYGKCARAPRYADYFEALGTSGRRAAAAYFRATAFRRITEVLAGPQPVVVPELDPALPLWEQAQTLGTVLGEYGWVEIRDAYDPAARAVAPQHAEQLALFEPAAARPPPPAPTAGPVVVIPCSGAKAAASAPTGRSRWTWPGSRFPRPHVSPDRPAVGASAWPADRRRARWLQGLQVGPAHGLASPPPSWGQGTSARPGFGPARHVRS
ncbi:hypothetical protein ABZ626_36715 [Streptomyces longispororuber]|uniref:hypothetical protein n=1 Tax=Streptomyces longispororuber TaxID=68230 RepID=UPI0034087ED5